MKCFLEKFRYSFSVRKCVRLFEFILIRLVSLQYLTRSSLLRRVTRLSILYLDTPVAVDDISV